MLESIGPGTQARVAGMLRNARSVIAFPSEAAKLPEQVSRVWCRWRRAKWALARLPLMETQCSCFAFFFLGGGDSDPERGVR